MRLFRPAEGATLDLSSLDAIAEGANRALDLALFLVQPGATALVLEGLEPEGEPAALGPPGTLQLSDPEQVVVSPGRALLRTRDGRMVMVQAEQPLSARWPGPAGPMTRAALVLIAQVTPAHERLHLACELATPALRIARPDVLSEPWILPLALPTGAGRDWMTDLARLWTPEHPALLALQKRLERLEQSIWRAEPEGSVWERQVLGRSWVRYQTAAVAALHAARASLLGRPSTTADRVRVLAELERQLRLSVEGVATELRGWFGAPEGSGPYRRVVAPEQTA